MRVLLAAHQGLALGGIGTARGYAQHRPATIDGHGTLTVAGLDEGCQKTGAIGGVGPSGGLARAWFEQVRLAQQARGFDLVHLSDLRPLVLSRVRFLLTVHDVDFLDRPNDYSRAARTYKAAMLGVALRKGPDRIICHSNHVRERLRHRLPGGLEDRVRVLPPGVESGALRWTGGGDRPFFLTVSTITARKNHLGLLAAYRDARARGLNLRWLVAGAPGPSSAGIIRALEQEPGVEVLGAVDRSALEILYRDALFVATPSLAEGFGYPPLEAMARGTPTVTSNAGSLAEVVGDAAPLLPPGDASGWADALFWLSQDAGARQELSIAGEKRAAEFSWQAAAARMVDLYSELAATPPFPLNR